jgi:enoyl-CoA hydratase/carnithine racemase
VRCVILTGAGEKSFVAGADIAAMSTMTKAEGKEFGKLGNDLFLYIESFPLPVIAAVNGFALGGGNELAMSCDIRLAAENAIFGQPEVGLGITPGFGGTQRLARLVGPGMAKQVIYSAINIDAAEALRIGLVNAVYPAEELMPAAQEAGRQDRPQRPDRGPLLQEGHQRGHQAADRAGRGGRGGPLRRLLRDPRPGGGHGLLPLPREAEAQAGVHQQVGPA